MAAKHVTAWRIWSAVPDGAEAQREWMAGQLFGALTACEVPWRNGWARAACLPTRGAPPGTDARDPRPHRSPGVFCECGIRGDSSLVALLAYGAAPNFTRWRDFCHVVGEVELYGRTAPRRRDDTPTTLRAERARVGRTVYFPEPLWPLMSRFEKLHPWSAAVPVLSLGDVPSAAHEGAA